MAFRASLKFFFFFLISLMISLGSVYYFFTVHLWFLQGLFKVSYQNVFNVLFGFHLGSKETKEQEVEQQKHMTEGTNSRS